MSGRTSGNDFIGLDIMRYNAAGTNHCSVSYGDSRHNNRAAAYPNIITNGNSFMGDLNVFFAKSKLFSIGERMYRDCMQRMLQCANRNIPGNRTVFPYVCQLNFGISANRCPTADF